MYLVVERSYGFLPGLLLSVSQDIITALFSICFIQWLVNARGSDSSSEGVLENILGNAWPLVCWFPLGWEVRKMQVLPYSRQWGGLEPLISWTSALTTQLLLLSIFFQEFIPGTCACSHMVAWPECSQPCTHSLCSRTSVPTLQGKYLRMSCDSGKNATYPTIQLLYRWTDRIRGNVCMSIFPFSLPNLASLSPCGVDIWIGVRTSQYLWGNWEHEYRNCLLPGRKLLNAWWG